jgi:hypothetical protein
MDGIPQSPVSTIQQKLFEFCYGPHTILWPEGQALTRESSWSWEPSYHRWVVSWIWPQGRNCDFCEYPIKFSRICISPPNLYLLFGFNTFACDILSCSQNFPRDQWKVNYQWKHHRPPRQNKYWNSSLVFIFSTINPEKTHCLCLSCKPKNVVFYSILNCCKNLKRELNEQCC